MKIIFNDATEMQAISCKAENKRLHILTASAGREELRKKFSDEFATKRIDVVNDGNVVESYERYTELYRIEEYAGHVFGVALNKAEKTSTEKLAEVEGCIKSVEEMLDIIVGGVKNESA